MYEAFYGLSDKPFQLNPDPSFFFGSRQHRRAMAYLEYGLHQSEGFIVITGEVGAGKTTLVRNLLGKLDPAQVVAVQLVSTQLDPNDMLRMVAAAFGLQTKSLEKSDLLLSLEAMLLSLTEQGKRALMIVDEAQNLPMGAVEELRMLSNFQIENHALLQSFLVGQPEFRGMLQSPNMQQLRQRVIASCHVGPMDEEDTRAYVEHRMRLVGWQDDPKFDPALFEAVYAFSGGIPRRINTICDRLLLSSFLAGKHELTIEDANSVIADIRAETHSAVSEGSEAKPRTAAISPADVSATPAQLSGISGLKLDPEMAAEAAHALSEARVPQLEERLARLERSVNVMVGLMQQLVEAASRPKT